MTTTLMSSSENTFHALSRRGCYNGMPDEEGKAIGHMVLNVIDQRPAKSRLAFHACSDEIVLLL